MTEKLPPTKSKTALSRPQTAKPQRYTPKLLKKINTKQNQNPTPQMILLKMKDLFYQLVEKLTEYTIQNGSAFSSTSILTMKITDLETKFSAFYGQATRYHSSVPAIHNQTMTENAHNNLKSAAYSFLDLWKEFGQYIQQIKDNRAGEIQNSIEEKMELIMKCLNYIQESSHQGTIAYNGAMRTYRSLKHQFIEIRKDIRKAISSEEEDKRLTHEATEDMKTFSRITCDAFLHDFAQVGFPQSEITTLRSSIYQTSSEIIRLIQAIFKQSSYTTDLSALHNGTDKMINLTFQSLNLPLVEEKKPKPEIVKKDSRFHRIFELKEKHYDLLAFITLGLDNIKILMDNQKSLEKYLKLCFDKGKTLVDENSQLRQNIEELSKIEQPLPPPPTTPEIKVVEEVKIEEKPEKQTNENNERQLHMKMLQLIKENSEKRIPSNADENYITEELNSIISNLKQEILTSYDILSSLDKKNDEEQNEQENKESNENKDAEEPVDSNKEELNQNENDLKQPQENSNSPRRKKKGMGEIDTEKEENETDNINEDRNEEEKSKETDNTQPEKQRENENQPMVNDKPNENDQQTESEKIKMQQEKNVEDWNKIRKLHEISSNVIEMLKEYQENQNDKVEFQENQQTNEIDELKKGFTTILDYLGCSLKPNKTLQETTFQAVKSRIATYEWQLKQSKKREETQYGSFLDLLIRKLPKTEFKSESKKEVVIYSLNSLLTNVDELNETIQLLNNDMYEIKNQIGQMLPNLAEIFNVQSINEQKTIETFFSLVERLINKEMIDGRGALIDEDQASKNISESQMLKVIFKKITSLDSISPQFFTQPNVAQDSNPLAEADDGVNIGTKEEVFEKILSELTKFQNLFTENKKELSEVKSQLLALVHRTAIPEIDYSKLSTPFLLQTYVNASIPKSTINSIMKELLQMQTQSIGDQQNSNTSSVFVISNKEDPSIYLPEICSQIVKITLSIESMRAFCPSISSLFSSFSKEQNYSIKDIVSILDNTSAQMEKTIKLIDISKLDQITGLVLPKFVNLITTLISFVHEVAANQTTHVLVQSMANSFNISM